MIKGEKNMNVGKKLKENKGVTLIALVVTIIVLLILAGISITMLTGESGILNRANKAKEMTENAKTEELINLSVADALKKGRGDLKDKNLKNALNNNIGEGNYTISGDEDNGWKVIANGKRYNINVDGTTSAEDIVLASGLEINGTMEIEQGLISELTVTQQGGGNEELEWSSSSENVEITKKGENTAIITGKKIGSATITATTQSSGKAATCSITVKEPTYIGQYLEYNIAYTDIYDTSKEYTAQNGWRILQMTPNEDETYDVEIISTGVPAGLYYDHGYITQDSYSPWAGTEEQRINYTNQYYGSENNDNIYAASGLIYNFKKIIFKQQSGAMTYNKQQYNTGYYTNISNNGETKTGDITGEIFIAREDATVRSIMHSDITGIKRTPKISVVDPTNATGLFILQNIGYTTGYYWLGSPSPSTTGVYLVSNTGYVGSNVSDDFGLRPVVSIPGVQVQKKSGSTDTWEITN